MGSSVHGVLAQAWQQFGDEVVTVVPHLLAALLVFVLGLAAGIVISRLANWVLRARDVDGRATRWGVAPWLEMLGIRSTVRALATALQVAILLGASLLALYSLDARLASGLAERLFLYLPHLVVALTILAGGFIAARFLARAVLIAAVNAEIRAAKLLAGLTRVAVMVVACAMAFEHLGISRETVLIAFAILFGGTTLAASLAAGLALQDVVRRWVGEQFGPPPPDPHPPIEHW